MNTIILRYVALFLLLTTVGLAILAIYRGEVISNYQAEALKNKTVEVKVVIDSVALADKISKSLDVKHTVLTVNKENTIHEIKEIVKDPVYLNVCIDNAGMQQLNKAILTPFAIEHDEPVSGSEVAE